MRVALRRAVGSAPVDVRRTCGRFRSKLRVRDERCEFVYFGVSGMDIADIPFPPCRGFGLRYRSQGDSNCGGEL